MPTRLHFGSQNPPKSFQKSIPRCTKFWIDFNIDFWLIFGRYWKPTWNHVGSIFFKNGGTSLRAAPVGSILFFGFLVVLGPSWLHLGSIFEGLALDLGCFWTQFWKFLVTISWTFKIIERSLVPMAFVVFRCFSDKIHLCNFWSRCGSHVLCNSRTFLVVSF